MQTINDFGSNIILNINF